MTRARLAAAFAARSSSESNTTWMVSILWKILHSLTHSQRAASAVQVCPREFLGQMNREHIHIACLRCGKITEFVTSTYDKLKQQVEKDCHFKILISRLEVGGYCAACRQ